MARFGGRALEDEYLQIVRDQGGDVSSRRAANQWLGTTHAVFHGEPVPWSVVPKIFDRAQLDVLADAAETMGRIMDKCTRAYLDSPSFRAQLGFDDRMDQLVRVPTSYTRLIPIARVDVFFNEQTGDYQFCELNTDGSSGMTDTVEVTCAEQRCDAWQEFSRRHPRLRTFDVLEGAIDAVLATYDSWAPAQGARAQEPVLAFVDYPESVERQEVDHLIERLQARGISARFADLRSLRTTPVDGRLRLVDDQGPIDLVWRRVVTSELVQKPCEGAYALERSVADDLACVVGTFRTWVCASKTIFSALFSPDAAQFLNDDELRFVHLHVPQTYRLSPDDDLSAYAQKDRWILKPAGGYNSVGVVAGLDCTQGQWEEALRQMASQRGVVQRYASMYKTPVLMGDVDAQADPLDAPLASNMEGLYLFDGKFGGVFTRCGLGNTIGEKVGRVFVGCVACDE